MTTPMQALLQFTGLKPSLFAANSRYQGIETGTLVTADGRSIAYVRRRFCPQPGQLALVQTYTVKQGDRLDNIAAQNLGDAEFFWRVCDANGAMRPEDLTATIGQALRITMPPGLPGSVNA